MTSARSRSRTQVRRQPRLRLALSLLTVLLAQPLDAAEPRLVRLATGSLAGTYFPVGIAVCRLVNETRAEHGIRCAATPSAGSVDNIRALRAGAVDLALVQSDVQEAARRGAGAFAADGPFADLRAVVSLHPEPLTVVASNAAGIGSLDGLPGRRVSYGLPGSGQRTVWDALADRFGWGDASFTTALELDPSAQAEALCSNRIDAFVLTVGHPATVVREATNRCGARLVSADGPTEQALVATSPVYFRTEIPGGLYRDNADPTPTFGVVATLVTRSDVPDPVVVEVVRAAIGKVEDLRSFNPALARLEPDEMTVAGLTAPLHPAVPGALREAGVLP